MIPAQFRAALVILRALLRPVVEGIKALAVGCDPSRHPDTVPLLPRRIVRHDSEGRFEFGQRSPQIAALFVVIVPVASGMCFGRACFAQALQRIAEFNLGLRVCLEPCDARPIGLAMPGTRPAQRMHDGGGALVSADKLGGQGASFTQPLMVCSIACRFCQPPVQMQFVFETPRFVLPPPAAGHDSCRFSQDAR
jgi:hypothetical protein